VARQRPEEAPEAVRLSLEPYAPRKVAERAGVEARALEVVARRIARAIEFLRRNTADQPDLAAVAHYLHLSEHHFQRLFTRWAGVSPKRFLQYLTVEHAKARLLSSQSVLDLAGAVGLRLSTETGRELFRIILRQIKKFLFFRSCGFGLSCKASLLRKHRLFLLGQITSYAGHDPMRTELSQPLLILRRSFYQMLRERRENCIEIREGVCGLFKRRNHLACPTALNRSNCRVLC